MYFATDYNPLVKGRQAEILGKKIYRNKAGREVWTRSRDKEMTVQKRQRRDKPDKETGRLGNFLLVIFTDGKLRS